MTTRAGFARLFWSELMSISTSMGSSPCFTSFVRSELMSISTFMGSFTTLTRYLTLSVCVHARKSTIWCICIIILISHIYTAFDSSSQKVNSLSKLEDINLIMNLSDVSNLINVKPLINIYKRNLNLRIFFSFSFTKITRKSRIFTYKNWR